MPDSPLARGVYGAAYRAWDAYEDTRELLGGKLVYEPMVRARFHQVGRDLQVSALPYVRGHAKVTIGDGCRFGYFSIRSGRFVDQPELVIGNNVSVASNVTFVVNRKVVIGDHVGIAGRCWISDSEGHPTDLDRRISREDLQADDIRILQIGDYVWIGHGAHILRGVSIGRAAIIAAGSVVTQDVPDGALAMGVPARIVRAG
jgi:carbonic anhydrase/acetyltransferase-like protein (isoleucine patch superfamily)